MDSQHEEHDLVEEIGPDDDEISVPENIIILTDEIHLNQLTLLWYQ